MMHLSLCKLLTLGKISHHVLLMLNYDGLLSVGLKSLSADELLPLSTIQILHELFRGFFICRGKLMLVRAIL